MKHKGVTTDPEILIPIQYQMLIVEENQVSSSKTQNKLNNYSNAPLNFEELVQHIIKNDSIHLIQGESGSGKTTIINQLEEYFKHNYQFKEQGIIPIQIFQQDFTNSNEIDIYKILYRQEFELSQTILDSLFEKIKRNSVQFYILIDNLDQIIGVQNAIQIQFVFQAQPLEKIKIVGTISDNQVCQNLFYRYKPLIITQIKQLDNQQIDKFLTLYIDIKLRKKLEQYYNQKSIQNNQFIEFWQEFQVQSENILINNIKDQKQLYENTEILNILQLYFDPNQIGEIQQIINQFLLQQSALKDYQIFFEKFNLTKLITTPEMLLIVVDLINNQNDIQNKYQFLQQFIINLVKRRFLMQHQELNEDQYIDQNWKELEVLCLNFIQEKLKLRTQIQQVLSQQNCFTPKIWQKQITNHKEIIDFFLARYFYNKLIFTGNQEQFVISIMESLIGKINLSEEDFKGVVNLVSEKCRRSKFIIDRLIYLVKLSSFQKNFEQVSGNAMTLLNSFEITIRQEDFSQIKIKNGKMDRLQFYDCDFFNSELHNEDITQTQFINCRIEKVNWCLQTKCEFFELKQNANKITIIVFSPDGKILAANAENEIKLWNLENRQELGSLNGHDQKIEYIQFSYDGQILISFSFDSTIRFWSLKKLKQINIFKNDCQIEYCKQIIYCQTSQSVTCLTKAPKIYNIINQRLIRKFYKNNNENYPFTTFAQNGDILVTGGFTHLIKLWNLKTGVLIDEISHHQQIRKLQLSYDNQYLAFASYKEKICLYSIKEKKEIQVLGGHSYVQELKFSPVEHTLSNMFIENRLQLYNLNDKCYYQVQNIHKFFSFATNFSQDGQFLASSESSILIQRINKEKENQILNGHHNFILFGLLSPDQRILASCDQSNTVNIWSIQERKIIQQIDFPNEQQSQMVFILQFSPDGRYLVHLSVDRSIHLWNLKLGKETHIIQVSNLYRKGFLKFSPDGSTILSCCSLTQITIWNIQTEQQIKFEEQPETVIMAIGYSEDGKIIACHNQQEFIQFWFVEDKKVIKQFKKTIEDDQCVEFSNDCKLFAFSSRDMTIHLLKLWQEHYVELIGHEFETRQIIFSPNGKIITSLDFGGVIRLWNVADGSAIQIIKAQQRNRYINFSQDGQFLVISNQDFSVNVWNIKKGKQIIELNGYNQTIRNSQIMPDGQIMRIKEQFYNLHDLIQNKKTWTAITYSKGILAQSCNNYIYLWDINEQKIISKLIGHKSQVQSITISHSARFLASGDKNGSIFLWNLLEHKQIEQLNKEDSATIHSIIFSYDDQVLITGNLDGSICIWDVQSLKLQKQLNIHQDSVYSITISQNNEVTLLAFSSKGQITKQNEQFENEIKISYLQEDQVNLVIFSPDNQFIACACLDNTIKLTEINTRKLVHQLEGHTDKINAIAFSTDIKLIISGGDDQTVRLWKVNTGMLLRCISDINTSVTSVLFISNNDLVAYGLDDGKVRIEKIQLDYNFDQKELFSPYLKLAQKQFRVEYCQVSDSQICSMNGNSLMDMFTYQKLN